MGRKKEPVKTLEELLKDDSLDAKEKYHYYVNKTDEWKQVRLKVLERDKYTCRTCGRTQDEGILTVHHRSYKNLFHEADNNYEDLITLCKICHANIHKAPSNMSRFKLDSGKNKN